MASFFAASDDSRLPPATPLGEAFKLVRRLQPQDYQTGVAMPEPQPEPPSVVFENCRFEPSPIDQAKAARDLLNRLAAEGKIDMHLTDAGELRLREAKEVVRIEWEEVD